MFINLHFIFKPRKERPNKENTHMKDGVLYWNCNGKKVREELLTGKPNKKNTYMKDGVLYWKCNGHKVSEKFKKEIEECIG